MLILHICTAMIGLLAGTMAMVVRKGSGLHAAAGNVYCGAMLTMGASAFFAALQPIGAWNGILAAYLVGTGWLAARRGGTTPGALDRLALVVALITASALFFHGVRVASSPTGQIGGYTGGIYFVFGSVALLSAIADIRMLVRGGTFGGKRIARHLWRMNFAFLMAAASFFLGQARLFPAAVRNSGLIYLPIVTILGMMLFWLARVRWTKSDRRNFGGGRPYTAARTTT